MIRPAGPINPRAVKWKFPPDELANPQPVADVAPKVVVPLLFTVICCPDELAKVPVGAPVVVKLMSLMACATSVMFGCRFVTTTVSVPAGETVSVAEALTGPPPVEDPGAVAKVTWSALVATAEVSATTAKIASERAR